MCVDCGNTYYIYTSLEDRGVVEEYSKGGEDREREGRGERDR